MSHHFQVVIVGLGPAGLAAAIELSQCSIKTAVIDQAEAPGGQVYRQTDPDVLSADTRAMHPRNREGEALIKSFRQNQQKLQVFTNTLVWDVFENSLNVLCHNEMIQISFERLIICEGAMERIIPFPGWTLPGVMTVGGCQKMIHHQNLMPGQRILVVGSGPLLLHLGATIIERGGGLVGLYQALHLKQTVPLVPHILKSKVLRRESLSYGYQLVKGRVLPKWGWGITSAYGEKKVQGASICRLDKNWRPIPGSEQHLPVDVIAVGHGFIPQSRLSRLCGCQVSFDEVSRSYKPRIDHWQRSSKEEIYIAGDSAGIGGADMANIQGRIAGIHAAFSLKQFSENGFQKRIAPWQNSRRTVQGYADTLQEIFNFRDGIYEIMTPETVVCRCEGVQAGTLWQLIDKGNKTLSSLKASRFSMGPCQGRVCESIVSDMLRMKGVHGQNLEPLHLRPPLSPLPLSVFEPQ